MISSLRGFVEIEGHILKKKKSKEGGCSPGKMRSAECGMIDPKMHTMCDCFSKF